MIFIATCVCSSWSNAFTTWPKLPLPVNRRRIISTLNKIDLVSIEELFPILDDIIMIIVVPAIVVEFPLFLMRAIFPLHLLCPPLLLRIVNLEKKLT
ncbi:hypothetical protein ALC62_06672 [Cyphomyrmex costatus]|uniref:Uncharacterized protein n=1 Tax=Cyphomyrmex costatus TaxID=456900 RepID=A0A151IIP6_9HYME|nr:hypothetical protein ALC62_06672 [Cyphomyrmex costatus]